MAPKKDAELFSTVRRLAREGKLPEGEVTREMMFALIADTNVMVSEVNGGLKKTQSDVAQIKVDLNIHKGDFDDHKKVWDDNPSLLFLFRYKTSKTIKTGLMIFFAIILAAALVAASPTAREALAGILGIN